MSAQGPVNSEEVVPATTSNPGSPAGTPRKSTFTSLADMHRERLKAQTPPPKIDGEPLSLKLKVTAGK